MLLKKNKNGAVKVLLLSMPCTKELEVLNQYGNFEVCKRRGYERLLHHGKVTMECPIKQWWTI